MTNPKFFFGPMTINIVDAIIEYSNETKTPFGFVPSRRQIEWDGGYTGFTTKEFIDYTRSNSQVFFNKNIIIERDHSGIGQGKEYDNGVLSQYYDAIYKIDLIHIDPWKVYKNYDKGLKETIDNITFIHKINPHIQFEVGTEEAIRKFSNKEFYKFLFDLSHNLKYLFNKITYAVIQSGTSLSGIKNTGTFDLNRLKAMVNICKEFGVMSKEHNGDYLTKEELKIRFDNGLDGINIAPELGVFETKILLEHININDFEQVFEICLEGLNWKKWVPANFAPYSNKKELIEIAGHYHNTEIKKFASINDIEIKEKIKKYLDEITTNFS